MKNFGRVAESKDITTVEYVEEKLKTKLEESDFVEITNERITEHWNQYMEDSDSGN